MLVPCPESPKLVKSLSDVEIETVVDSVLNDIVDKAVMFSKKVAVSSNKKNLRYIKLSEKQNVFVALHNVIFFLLLKFRIIFYQKKYAVNATYLSQDGSHKSKMCALVCTDKYLLIGNTQIYYEYIASIRYNPHCVFIKLVNDKVLFLKSKCAEIIYKTVSSNLQYHVRYNKINCNVSKYKSFKKTVTVY